MIATTARLTYRCLLVSMASNIRSAAPRTIKAGNTAYRLRTACSGLAARPATVTAVRPMTNPATAAASPSARDG